MLDANRHTYSVAKQRYLTPYVIKDLSEKMVFIGGPRQVGKTTLAKELVSNHFQRFSYYNWDNRQDRQNIMQSKWTDDAELIILDEVHKYRKWKSHVKGGYDKLKDKYKFLVTGSASLDVYRKGGDAMLGRYHYYRLHPFTMSEIIGNKEVPVVHDEIPIWSQVDQEAFSSLDRFGGFPEPYLKQNVRTLRRWQNERLDRLYREDVKEVRKKFGLSA